MNDYKKDVPFYQRQLAAEAPIDKTKIVEKIQNNQFKRQWQPSYRKPNNPYAKQIEKLAQRQTPDFNFEIDDK